MKNLNINCLVNETMEIMDLSKMIPLFNKEADAQGKDVGFSIDGNELVIKISTGKETQFDFNATCSKICRKFGVSTINIEGGDVDTAIMVTDGKNFTFNTEGRIIVGYYKRKCSIVNCEFNASCIIIQEETNARPQMFEGCTFNCKLMASAHPGEDSSLNHLQNCDITADVLIWDHRAFAEKNFGKSLGSGVYDWEKFEPIDGKKLEWDPTSAIPCSNNIENVVFAGIPDTFWFYKKMGGKYAGYGMRKYDKSREYENEIKKITGCKRPII